MWGQASAEDLYFIGENPQSVTTMRHEPTTRYPVKKVKRNKSFIKLLLPGMVRWVITLLLMAGFYLAIWSYQERVISPTTKSIFDAIIVGISIAFSLNIGSSLKAIALDLRW
jgi:hypothetical protein